MAQPQPQYTMAAQASPSPVSSTNGFPLPQAKRQKTSPQPSSQPGSPYVAVQQPSPYTMSPGASTTQSTSASPHFANVHLPHGAYSTPYANGQNANGQNANGQNANGQTTPTLNLPQSNQPFPAGQYFPSPGQNQMQNSGQPSANYMMNPQNQQIMGPPSKPVEKPKEEVSDQMDILTGSGIDLREEELYTWQLTNNSFHSQQTGSQSGTISSGNSFSQFAPADGRSFYGAGPANAATEVPETESQEEFHTKVVESAWKRAAYDLSISRQRELSSPFLVVNNVSMKMDRIARENGLTCKRDVNNAMGIMRLPGNFQSANGQAPITNAQTVIGPNSAMTVTSGTFVQNDSLMVDQVALLSIAAKHRVQGLIEDAVKLAKNRITNAHGVIPEEWKDVAVPDPGFRSAPDDGWQRAVSPRSNPLNRSLSVANRFPTPVLDGAKTPSTKPAKQFTGEVARALREAARIEREFEEKRIKKRKERAEGSRGGSAMPGTPGSMAPEPMEKAPTKKESKKAAASEAENHKAANATTAAMLGTGRSVFGKKKKYSWMTGGSGSAVATPAQIMSQISSGGSSAQAEAAPEPKLTVEPARRLGMWRDDGEKGRGVQMRDWVTILEQDGRDKQALQRAYALLEETGHR